MAARAERIRAAELRVELCFAQYEAIARGGTDETVERLSLARGRLAQVTSPDQLASALAEAEAALREWDEARGAMPARGRGEQSGA